MRGRAHLLAHPAGVLVEILDQAGRGIGVEMIDQRVLGDVDLAALEHARHRHHERELLQGALIVVDHGDHGLAVVADEDDLGGRLNSSLSALAT